jgi:glycosyltransferase involved in cell wall biosynthesis
MTTTRPVQSLPHVASSTLLFVAFDIDEASQVLAWQQLVASELSQYFERTIVVAERVGKHKLPANIQVLQMPRLFLYGFLKPLCVRWLLLPWLAWKLRGVKIDVIFYHMCFEWAERFKFLAQSKGALTGMWYAHGSISSSLERAANCVDVIFTSSKEGFRLKSEKVRVIGQAIDLSIFPLRSAGPTHLHIGVVGRISARKGCHLCITALKALIDTYKIPATLEFIGAPLTSADADYLTELSSQIKTLGLESAVTFTAPLPLDQLGSVFNRCTLLLNLSSTGSMDKVVLEALASGCPVLTSNEAFKELLATFPQMYLSNTTPESVAKALIELYAHAKKLNPLTLRALIEETHDLKGYALRIVREMEKTWAASG